MCRRGPRRSAPKPIGRGSLYSLSGVLFMVLTTEGKIMPPQSSRILKLSWCRTVRYGRQRPNRGCQERPLRVEPLRSRARSGKVRKSALCSRSLTTRRMGESAPSGPARAITSSARGNERCDAFRDDWGSPILDSRNGFVLWGIPGLFFAVGVTCSYGEAIPVLALPHPAAVARADERQHPCCASFRRSPLQALSSRARTPQGTNDASPSASRR